MDGGYIGGNQVELYKRGPGIRDPTCSKVRLLKVYEVSKILRFEAL